VKREEKRETKDASQSKRWDFRVELKERKVGWENVDKNRWSKFNRKN